MTVAAHQDRQHQIQRVFYITLVFNLVVFAIKLGLGLTTGSLSLIADALHSTTDSASNILALVAMRFSNPEPDDDHPYGHSKFEAIGALGIAAFLGAACLEILRTAIHRFIDPGSPVTVSPLSLQLMIVVLIINIGVTVYEHERGKTLNSRLLLADARHTLSDIWVSLLVLVGLVGVRGGWTWLDHAFAFPVAAMVCWSGWQVLQENIPLLTDHVAIPPKQIRDLVMQVEGVLDCHEVRSRGVIGQMVFMEMHMVVAPLGIEDAHRITEDVEELLKERFGAVRVTIHLEPYSYIEGSP
ncbi:MAG: cation diffusion facilitator family transporter [Synechococcales cyanobacterium]